MSDVCLYAGFCLAVAGLYLLTGLGWTLLIGGLALFVVGGLNLKTGRQ